MTSCAALITLGHSFIFPPSKIVLGDLTSTNSGCIALVVFVVNWQSGIVGYFFSIILLGGKCLTVLRFAGRNAVTVFRIIIALHDEVAAAPLALAESDILL